MTVDDEIADLEQLLEVARLLKERLSQPEKPFKPLLAEYYPSVAPYLENHQEEVEE